MCGIVGFWHFAPENTATLEANITRMSDRMLARGPDSSGLWLDGLAGLALGHRRLAIVDLSPAGHQPMASHNGRYQIVYNGELYNTPELRADLEKGGLHSFKGHSDTEVLLELCARDGVEKTLPRLNGIFAFALWDREKRELVLARDHFGIKPLQWGFMQGVLLFGSDMHALKRHPAWQQELDIESVAGFLQFGYVPGGQNIYKGMHKLAPGHFVRIKPDRTTHMARYYDARAVAQASTQNRLTGSASAATDALDQLLQDAIGRQMMADVPLGAFLSGGIDSSVVVAIMQKLSARPVNTFAIGFNDARFDEAPHAKAVAQALGTKHHEHYFADADLLNLIPKIPEWYDEPFADSSQLPTYLVSHIARQHVTVALSGDGGDELFAGYGRYGRARMADNLFPWAPRPLRRLGASAIRALHPERWNRWPALGRLQNKAQGLARILEQKFDLESYFLMVGQWRQTGPLMADGRDRPLPAPWHDPQILHTTETVERLQLLDTLTYLPDDILVKADRASMATSLELRVPLLDPRLLEFAWRVKPEWKWRGSTNKWLLRQLLYRYVPEKIVNRPKMGFGVPLGAWLRGPLRDWAGDLLSESNIQRGGILNPALISQRWQQHQSGQIDWGFPLWNVLMLQQWLASTQGQRT